MLSKNQLKDVRKLGQKKFRDEFGRTMAEGLKLVKEILETDPSLIETLLLTEDNVKYFEAIPYQVVSSKEMEQVSLKRTPPGIAAVIKMVNTNAQHDPSQWTIALEDIRDPGNLGTILRTAAWFGFQQVLCSPNCVDVNNPKVINASMGSVYRLAIRYVSIEEEAERYERIYGAVLKGDNVFENGLTEPGMLLIGNESKGISDQALDIVTNPITIPGGGTESLNASVAAGLIMGQIYQHLLR